MSINVFQSKKCVNQQAQSKSWTHKTLRERRVCTTIFQSLLCFAPISNSFPLLWTPKLWQTQAQGERGRSPSQAGSDGGHRVGLCAALRGTGSFGQPPAPSARRGRRHRASRSPRGSPEGSGAWPARGPTTAAMKHCCQHTDATSRRGPHLWERREDLSPAQLFWTIFGFF